MPHFIATSFDERLSTDIFARDKSRPLRPFAGAVPSTLSRRSGAETPRLVSHNRVVSASYGALEVLLRTSDQLQNTCASSVHYCMLVQGSVRGDYLRLRRRHNAIEPPALLLNDFRPPPRFFLCDSWIGGSYQDENAHRVGMGPCQFMLDGARHDQNTSPCANSLSRPSSSHTGMNQRNVASRQRVSVNLSLLHAERETGRVRFASCRTSHQTKVDNRHKMRPCQLPGPRLKCRLRPHRPLGRGRDKSRGQPPLRMPKG